MSEASTTQGSINTDAVGAVMVSPRRNMAPWAFWAAAFFIIAFVFLTRGVLLPFLFGLAVAYLLDPLTDKLEERGVPRAGAAALVIALFFLLSVGVLVGFWPIVRSQLVLIGDVLPGKLGDLRDWLDATLAQLHTTFDIPIEQEVEGLLTSASSEILTQAERLAASLLTSSLALFNLVSLMLISPVVAFYLLRDWDNIIAKIDSWLPNGWGVDIRTQAREMDSVLAGFVHGQMMVCLIMGVLYGLGWTLVGLDFGLLLGVLAGLMAFIPFVGVLVAAGVAVLVGFGQWGFDTTQLGLVVLVFFVVQFLEGMILTPNLVGDRVRLHPVWVLFAVFAGGEVMGFVGVLIAVPAAAAIAVIVRYWLARWREHHGLEHLAADQDGDISQDALDQETDPSASDEAKAAS